MRRATGAFTLMAERGREDSDDGGEHRGNLANAFIAGGSAREHGGARICERDH
jgi:hypothetical protein